MKQYKVIFQNYHFNQHDFKEFIVNRLKLTPDEIVTIFSTGHVTLSNHDSITIVNDFSAASVYPRHKELKLY